MQYARHNFNHNFLSANGSKDEDSTKDILISELADLIADSPSEVITALNQSDVGLPGNATEKQIADITIEQLETNKSFIKRIATMISSKNKGDAKKFSNNSGAFGSPQASVNVPAGPSSKGGQKVDAQTVTTVADSIATIFGFFKSQKDLKAQQQAYKDQLNANLNSRPKTKGRMSAGAKIAIGFGVAALLGSILFLVFAKRKTA